MQDEQLNLRKIALVITGCIIAVVAFAWLVKYLAYGRVVVSTNNPNATITLTQINDEKATEANVKRKTITGHKKLSVQVKSGQYVATVTGNSIGTTQLVSVKARHTVRYTLNPINPSGIAPVIYSDAQGVLASADELLYLDTSTGDIKKVDKNNSLGTVGGHYPLRSVSWASTDFGVAQDGGGKLYTIDVPANSIGSLSVPFSYGDNQVGYAVASDGNIYISSGKNVYVGNRNGNFKKVYTAASSHSTLTAGVDSVLVNDNTGEGSHNEPFIAVVDKSGKLAGDQIDANLASWSPDGRYVVAAAETGAVIYDKSLHTVVNVPSNTFISHFAWLDNHTLFYSSDDQIWAYDVLSRSSHLVANMPLGQGVLDLSLNPSDKSYLYMVSGGSQAGGSAIRRLSLRGQKTPDEIYQVQKIFPDQQASYSLGLVNFAPSPTQPVILVTPYANSSAINYIQAAKDEMRLDGFDTGQFQFQQASPKTFGD